MIGGNFTAKILAAPPKVDKYLPPSRERTPKAPCELHHYREGPPTGPSGIGASPLRVVERRPDSSFPTVHGPSVDNYTLKTFNSEFESTFFFSF